MKNFRFVIAILLALVFTGTTFARNSPYNNMLFSNDYKTVRKAISLGADVNCRLRNSTPLYDAARKGNFDIMYLLLKRGANVNAMSHGETALHKTVTSQNLKSTKQLLKEGANPNIKDGVYGNTPLQYAVNSGNVPMIKLLLDYGADMNVVNNLGQTPASTILKNVKVDSMTISGDGLELVTSPFTIGSGAVSISIQNNNKDYVNVANVALYIDGKMVDQKVANVSIPPNSKINVGSIPIPFKLFTMVQISKSGVAKINYGFAVEYKIKNNNNNLYDSVNTKVKVW